MTARVKSCVFLWWVMISACRDWPYADRRILIMLIADSFQFLGFSGLRTEGSSASRNYYQHSREARFFFIALLRLIS